MSSILAVALVSVLYIALVSPFTIVILRRLAIMPLAIPYILLISALASYHSGLFDSAALPAGGIPDPDLNAPDCVELLRLLDQANIIVDRRSPPRLVVAEAQWTQLPDEVRNAVATCVQRSWPTGSPAARIELTH